MATQLNIKNIVKPEQTFILPGYYNWQQFKTLQLIIQQQSSAKIAYLDGQIELMTTGEEHESIKTMLGFLIELYLCEKEIDYNPVGSATREAEIKGASFQPDESYYLDQTRANPDLAVEVVFSSGGINKLEKYKRFTISEVWFWENNQLSIYYLRNENHEKVNQSILLPDLDIGLLIRCMSLPSRPQAKKQFLAGI